MLTIDLYITRLVLSGGVIVLVALLGLVSLFALAEAMSDADTLLMEALRGVALTLPRRAYEVLPFAVFLGTLMSLGALAGHSELVAVRAAGMSVERLFVSVALPGVVLIGIGVLLGEYLAPAGERRAELVKLETAQRAPDAPAPAGYWYRHEQTFMHVDGLKADGGLIGVSQFQLAQDGRLKLARQAQAAEFNRQTDTWEMKSVRESHFDSERVRATTRETANWTDAVNPSQLNMAALVEPRKLSISALLQQMRFVDRRGLQAREYALAFWTKVTQPLAVLGLSLLALAFVLGPLRETSLGARLSVGIFAGLGFKYLQDFFAPLCLVYDVPPLLATLVPIFLCWIAGAWLIRRVA